MPILSIFISTALIVISLITILNVLMIPHLHHREMNHPFHPMLSILIPARNEAHVIQSTLASLLAQDYPYMEILLLDDDSTDNTGQIARSFHDPRLTIVSGEPLPPDWLGKNRACHRLAQMAHGDYLIFTDADVSWSPGAVRALVNELTRTNADLLTIWPTQHTVTWSERLIVPLMALAIVGYLPVIGTHYFPSEIFAAACGQCMAWKRPAYFKIGGHQSVACNVLEDVTMARLVKRSGLRLRMADGNDLVNCRMYTDWDNVRNGYAKNILTGYGNSVPALLLATVFHWLIFILPPLSLLTGWLPQAIGLTITGIGIRMVTAAATRQRILDGLFMPVSVVLMTIIAFQSVYWHYHGGPHWKGRDISQPIAQAQLQPQSGKDSWTQQQKTSSS
ncbi:MAG TPA: glycosyltransferase [Phototrophicaceae bacterium]|jgi:chlorobactene glucosyltransferase|nr:glycosyltransferase [Phototrophicaceae bacterium]